MHCRPARSLPPSWTTWTASRSSSSCPRTAVSWGWSTLSMVRLFLLLLLLLFQQNWKDIVGWGHNEMASPLGEPEGVMRVVKRDIYWMKSYWELLPAAYPWTADSCAWSTLSMVSAERSVVVVIVLLVHKIGSELWYWDMHNDLSSLLIESESLMGVVKHDSYWRGGGVIGDCLCVFCVFVFIMLVMKTWKKEIVMSYFLNTKIAYPLF